MLFTACQQPGVKSSKDYTELVNVFIGTGGHGHTFPGATVPNGLVQLSPDTRFLYWDAASGYHYSDSSLAGFSHTHLSGTGNGDYGDILFMPFTGSVSLVPGDKNHPDAGYRSRFSHNKEVARPGYYSVFLDDYKVKAELTATTRTGFHRYTYPESNASGVIIDLSTLIHKHSHLVENLGSHIEILSDTEIAGYKHTSGWARDQKVYFYAKFSKPFTCNLYNGGHLEEDTNQITAEDLMATFHFSTEKEEQVLVKVGISNVSWKGAKLNLEQENHGWDFNATCADAADLWNDKLSKIDVAGGTKDQREIFYTALYHCYMHPNVFTDVDGTYRGIDGRIHRSEKKDIYTVFSLWDTYRAFHPLMTIIDPDFNNAMIRSLINTYEKGGILPKWELWANYTGTMIGAHAVSVISDAYLKGAKDFDAEMAYQACKSAVHYDTTGILFPSDRVRKRLMPQGKFYNDQLGFIPADYEGQSVSKALEYAYNDYCIAQMAKKLGKRKDYTYYMERSTRYKKYFDKHTGFMRGRNRDGGWQKPFDPKFSDHLSGPYTEGNAYQWSWYVPHDVEGLINIMGGKEVFTQSLDELFNTNSAITGERASADISGLIGQYAHGNEPSQHIAYMYLFSDTPWKTQHYVDSILTTLYSKNPDGLSGNEDCGQMSAWYLLNAMGLYSFCPGNPEYLLGRPLFDEVILHLDKGKKFVIKADNNSSEKRYVHSMLLNGEPLKGPGILHEDIMAGGLLEFEMSDEPGLEW